MGQKSRQFPQKIVSLRLQTIIIKTFCLFSQSLNLEISSRPRIFHHSILGCGLELHNLLRSANGFQTLHSIGLVNTLADKPLDLSKCR